MHARPQRAERGKRTACLIRAIDCGTCLRATGIQCGFNFLLQIEAPIDFLVQEPRVF